MSKRTDKHLLKLDFNTHPEEFQTILDVMHAYQKQKNLFSDMLNSYHWNQDINLLQGFDFRTIRNSLKGYKTPYTGLSARLTSCMLEHYQLKLTSCKKKFLRIYHTILLFGKN